jgi:hypothetical protein
MIRAGDINSGIAGGIGFYRLAEEREHQANV